VAALLGTILLLVLLLHQKSSGSAAVIDYDRKGLMWAVCAGLAVGTAEMLSFCVSGMGVPATHFIPISKYAFGGIDSQWTTGGGAILSAFLIASHFIFDSYWRIGNGASCHC